MKRWKRRLLGPLVSLAVLLLLLAAIEGVLRLRAGKRAASAGPARIHQFFRYDENGCFRIEPNSRGWHRPYDGREPVLVSINSAGLRGPEPRPEASTRIAFVGDSITFDGGVAWEDGFVALTEARLGGGDVECLNFGTTDAGIVEYERKVRHHVTDFPVDAVVVGLYLNDSRPPQGFLGESSHEPWEARLARSPAYSLLTVREVHRLVRTARLSRNPELMNRFRWVERFRRGAWRESEEDWLALVEEAEYDWGAAWKEENWPPVEQGLARIAEIARERGARPLLLLFPVSPQVEIEGEFEQLRRPQERARELAQRLGLPVLDLLPAFRAAGAEGLFDDQCHLTAKGNRVAAEAIAPWLARELELPAPPAP